MGSILTKTLLTHLQYSKICHWRNCNLCYSRITKQISCHVVSLMSRRSCCMTATSKPRRPFGVTLALVGGVFVFSLIPTLMIFVLAYLSNYVQTDLEGGISGIEFTGGNF